MSTNTLGLFLRHLALSEEVNRLGAASDRDLLTAYEMERGQAAFTELMRRHGPMVLRTCRRVLGHGPDAEDAFQATFLLLARKAGQLRREVAGPLSLGGWLHRVAYQTALDVFSQLVRRKAHERQAGAMTHSHRDPAIETTWNEIQPILDAELNALPDEARRLLIACYLQEKTHIEAAAELGLPPGSVAWRLEKARTLLAQRLARRGITVSALLLAVLLEESARGAGMPAVLLVHTVEAARRFTQQATGIVSDHVARLVKGGLAKMAKGWTHRSMALLAWASLLGAGLIACQTLKAWPDQPPESELPAASTVERPAQKEKQARTDRYGDPLPAGALARMGTTRLRNEGYGNQVLFAPDGKTVASGGYHDTVRLWDVATGKLVRSLKQPPERGLRPVSFSPDGKTLTLLTTSQLWLWDVRTDGPPESKLQLKLEEDQRVVSLAISSDGKMAASGGYDAAVRLWDMATGKQLRVLRGHDKWPIRLLSFSPDNKTLAMGPEGKVVQLWDVSSGKLLHKLEHPLLAYTAAFSPDGKTLASAGSDTLAPGSDKEALLQWIRSEGNPSVVRLWDVATGKLVRTLEGHQHKIYSLSFSRDGKVLASGSEDRTIRLWDVTAGKQLHKLKCLGASSSLSFAPDGKVLASSGSGPAVHLWDVTTGAELHRPGEAHTGQVQSVSFAPDGRTLATAAAQGEGLGTVCLWEAASGKPLRTLEHPEGTHALAHEVAFAPDGKTLAAAGKDVVRLWDPITGKLRRKLAAPGGGSPLAFSPDGKLLVAGSNDEDGIPLNKTLHIWDVATGTQLHTLQQPGTTIAVAFSPDGRTLAVGTGGILCLWDAVTGKELRKVDRSVDQLRRTGKSIPEAAKESWGVAALSFSPDGKTLAVGGNNKIHLVEVPGGQELRRLTLKHCPHIKALAFSPSGRWLAFGGDDQTVRLWEVNAGLTKECHQFRGHTARVTAVAFSPDGQRLVSASEDSTALVWDITGLAKRQISAAPLTQGELTSLWQSLASTNAARAYQTLRTLAAAPDQTVPFLAGRLLRKKSPDPQQVARLLAELDSEDFRVRSQATKELEQWGEAVEPALRQALKDKPSIEVRRRIRELLKEINPPHPEGVSLGLLRWLRAVEVLEWMGTPTARELLEKVAAAPPRAEVGQQARAALKRLHALAAAK